MAIGSKVADMQAFLANAVLDIRPTGTEEWTIHNVYYSAAVQFIKTNGTTSVAFDSDSAAGGKTGTVFNVTNAHWLQIKATTAGNIGYDGVKTQL